MRRTFTDDAELDAFCDSITDVADDTATIFEWAEVLLQHAPELLEQLRDYRKRHEGDWGLGRVLFLVEQCEHLGHQLYRDTDA